MWSVLLKLSLFSGICIYYKQNIINTLINVCYLGIYTYSYLEIKCKKIYKLFICSSQYHSITPFRNNIIQNNFIVYNKEIGKKSSITLYRDEIIIIMNNDNGIIINNQKKMDKYFENIYNNIPIECTNYQFSLLLFYLNNVECEVKLKSFYYNFYIVDNVLDKQFLSYFGKKYLNYYAPIETYKIIIIDQNANYLEVPNNKKIVLDKENYRII